MSAFGGKAEMAFCTAFALHMSKADIRRPFRLSELRNAIRRKFVTPMVIAVGSKSVGEIIGLPANQLELRRDGEAAESHRPLPQDGAATCPR